MSNDHESSDVESRNTSPVGASLQKDALSNVRGTQPESSASERASRLAVLVDITADGPPTGLQPDDALTFIAESLQASAESLVEAFNRSQGRKRTGLQLSVSLSRGIGRKDHRTNGLEFVSAALDIELDPDAEERPELTQAGYAAARAVRL